MITRLLPFTCLLAGLAATPAAAQTAEPDRTPEDTIAITAQEAGQAAHFMVSAAHPLAAQVGYEVLQAGGTAADAAIAVQLVLNLVEPQSSGLGGGAFVLYYDAATDRLTTYDARETAPLAAGGDLFLDAAGEPMGFWDAVVGGRSVGTPGTPRLLEVLHENHGRTPWAELFQPAIALAEDGFTVGQRLAGTLTGARGEALALSPTAAGYFFPAGQALAAGDLVRNTAFAETLRTLADGGANAFYYGPLAEAIVETVTSHPTNPGLLALDDLRAYEVVERPAVCLPYRGYEVCGMGPPSSGGLTVGQMLGLLEHFDMAALGPNDPDAWHLFAEAGALAFADRNRYMADADFVNMPGGLLDPAYLTVRAQAIDPDTALPRPVAPGNPPWREAALWADDASQERPGTSHIAIIDAEGNALSMTTTIESAFGSTLMVGGFLLNNELTDFSFQPEEDGRPVANRVEPGKRPRSSMAPTIVFDADGGVRLVIGSPGGSRIIAYVARVIVSVLDWGYDVQTAISQPNAADRNGATDLEEGTEITALAPLLEARGHDVSIRDLNSGLHGIEVLPDGTLRGGADPRREGTVHGD
ncbi:MAG: gamma-glutamyltransferase [Rhodospirillaceae bacterium]|nr:gamma-glutamyltransferase [Rhodospirillaceae bacterium]